MGDVSTSKYFDAKSKSDSESDIAFKIYGYTIRDNDVNTLTEGQFLNDMIIDFYLEYIWRQLPEERRRKIHVFSHFLWRKLSQHSSNGSVKMHAEVARWTKNVDLFEKDFILIPINEHAHWYLAIVCFPSLEGPVYSTDSTQEPAEPAYALNAGSDRSIFDEATVGKKRKRETSANGKKRLVREPLIIILDSLHCGGRKTARIIREYLTQEWSAKKPHLAPKRFVGLYEWSQITDNSNLGGMRGFYPSAPQQGNFSDCGVFVLEYAERFMKSGMPCWTANKKGEWDFGPKSQWADLTKWFPTTRGHQKRLELIGLMFKLAEEYRAARRRDTGKSKG